MSANIFLLMFKVPHLICVGQKSKLAECDERFFQNSPRLNTFSVLTSLMDEVQVCGCVCVCAQTVACPCENRRWRLAEQKQQKAARKKNRGKQRLPDLDNDK